MAEMFASYSSEKRIAEDGGRSTPSTLAGVGSQLPPSTSRHLMQPSSDVDYFTFGQSFWQAHNDDVRTADDSDNLFNRLPDLDYQNVRRRKVSRKIVHLNKSG